MVTRSQDILISAGVIRKPTESGWGFKPMNEGPEQPDDTDERRARAIEQLVEKAVASPDPIGWVKDFMLRALSAEPWCPADSRPR